MRIVITLIFVCQLSLMLLGQNIQHQKRDSIYIDHASKYINNELGSEFVASNIKYDGLYHHGLSMVVYKTVATKNMEGRNSLIIYFKPYTYDVDSQNTVIDKQEIIKSIRCHDNCNLLIGQDQALIMAEKAGLKKGLKKWNPKLINWDGDLNKPQWTIKSTYRESTSRPYYGRGENVNIDMKTGEFKKSMWSAQE